MAIFEAGVNLAGEQVDPGEQAQRAMTLVFMITRPARMRPRLRWQVWGGVPDGLYARLLVVGNDRDVRLGAFARAQNRDLAIDAQDLGHFLLEGLVAALEVVAHLVRPHIVLVEDLADRALSQARQAAMPSRLGSLSDVARSSRVVQSSCGYPPSLGFCQANDTTHARASSVIVGSLPGRGLSSSAAITPNRTARSRHRCTV